MIKYSGMKKLYKLSLIVLIPLISGLVLVIVGNNGGNENIARIGRGILSIGLPVTMFLLVVIGIVLMITGKLSDKGGQDDGEPTPRTKEDEALDIADVNSSYGYESRRKSGEYMINRVADNYKNSSAKDKLLGWLFFGFLMVDFFLILVFAMLRNMTGTIVCFSIFGGTILIAIIAKIIVQKFSMRVSSDKLDGKEAFKGVVAACLLSSTTSTGGTQRSHTTRITKVVYRILIDRDGEQFVAYSDKFYEEGEEVFFVVRYKSLVAIVDADKVRSANDVKF